VRQAEEVLDVVDQPEADLRIPKIRLSSSSASGLTTQRALHPCPQVRSLLWAIRRASSRIRKVLPVPKSPRAAFRLGSGSLLLRDASGRFSFIHQSVLERLVVRWGVSELLNERAPQQLARREMSALMVDFFAALAGRERIVSWVEGQLAEPSAPAASANALLVAKRLKISLAPARKELAGGDLRGKDFSGQDMSFGNLPGADLSDALLAKVILEGANLIGAQFRGICSERRTNGLKGTRSL
jgi:Pentapeptide repeats (8 copies)